MIEDRVERAVGADNRPLARPRILDGPACAERANERRLEFPESGTRVVTRGASRARPPRVDARAYART